MKPDNKNNLDNSSGETPAVSTRRLLIAILSTIALADFGLGLNTVVLPLYAKSLGASILTIGLIIASFGLARILVNIPVSIMSKKFKMQFMHIGIFFILAGAVGYYFSTFYDELFVFRFLEGFGSGIINTSSMIMLTKHLYQNEKRAKVLSKYMIARRLSMGIAPFIGAIVAFKFTDKSAFLLYASVMFLAFFISLYNKKFLKYIYNGNADNNYNNANGGKQNIENAAKNENIVLDFNEEESNIIKNYNNNNGNIKDKETFKDKDIDIDRDITSEQPRKKRGYLDLLANISFILLCFLTFSFFFSRIGSRRELVPLVGISIMHLNIAYIGLLVSISALIGVTLTYYSDRTIQRFGIKRSIVISFIISAIGILWFIIFQNLAGFAASIILLSAGGGFSGPARNLYLMDSVDRNHYDEAIGIYRTLSDLGFVLGPFIIGAVFYYSNYLAAYSVIAAIIVIAAIAFNFFAK
jgi:MFS family permease